MVTGTGATVEQDPTGLWWITSDDAVITGPYLDEVQATRALHTGGDTPPTVVVVHTTTSAAPLQCALQTTADDETEGRDGSR